MHDMTLERFRRARMVVQKPETPAFEAARAMESNHIGVIVVQDQGDLVGVVTDRDLAVRVVGACRDPRTTLLREIMTPDPISLPITSDEVDALDVMRRRRVRRVVLREGEQLAGIVTLDDLVVAEPVDTVRLAEVVIAQLAAPAPMKPAGVLHPSRPATPRTTPRPSSGSRHAARAIQTSRRVARLCADVTGLEDFDQAMTALEVVVSGIARRLMPSEAGDLLAQLPSELKDRLLDELPAGPERSLTRDTIELELSRRLDIDEERARELVEQVGTVLEHLVSEGEIADVRAQLPADMKSIFRGEVAHRTP